jgi:TolB-like protein
VRLAQARAGQGRRLEIARQVLEALGTAHSAGLIHRDLKPQNIMVRFDGYVKVLDFGLAKQIATAHAAQVQGTTTTNVTVPGQIFGTVAYMSPEQILGQPVNQCSDLFAFGVILYEMLAGRHPFRRDSSVDTMHAILHNEPPSMESVSPRIVPILRKLLRKNPGDRFPSAQAVREAFAESAVGPEPSVTVEQEAAPLTSIAVIPFLFLNEIEDRKALSLGFADALITTLGSLEDLTVLPTSTVLNCVPGVDPARTCRELGVRHLLQGNVQKQGAHWRVSTQLFDSQTQKISLAEKYDFVRENVFEVQDEIGRRVMDSLQIRFRRAIPKSRDRYSSDPQAFEEFMEGLRESYSDREETVRSAAEHLSRAVQRDPEFALAHATLSYAAIHMSMEFDADSAWRDKAEYHCGRALALDPSLPEGHSARAFILWSPANNFQHVGAISALEKVLAAQPNNERAHNRMAAICSHIGRFEEAIVAHKRARQSNPKTRANNTSSSFFSGAAISPVRKRLGKLGFEKSQEPSTLSGFTQCLP